MRNIFLFIWKNHVIFLFVLLEIFCFTLIIRHNRYQQASFVNASNAISGNMVQAYTNVTEYFALKKANEQLAKENARFHAREPQSYYKYDHEVFQIKDSIYVQQYTYITAQVINNSVNKRNNYITLNRGSKQGIEPGMGVISPQGYVGVVTDVSQHFSVVQSFLHKLSSVSAKLYKSNYSGIMEWPGRSSTYGLLKDIPGHVELNKGDTVVTTSFSMVFPQGITLGTIEEPELNTSTNFYDIKVKLSTDFQKLDHVYIVNNLLKKEQLELEQLAKQEDAE